MTIAPECEWCEIGDIDRLGFVLRNISSSPVVVPVGVRIARVIFHYTGLPKFYIKGTTQTTAALDSISNSWRPSSLLPKSSASTNKFSIEKVIDKEYSVSPKDILESSEEEDSSEIPEDEEISEGDEARISLD